MGLHTQQGICDKSLWMTICKGEVLSNSSQRGPEMTRPKPLRTKCSLVNYCLSQLPFQSVHSGYTNKNSKHTTQTEAGPCYSEDTESVESASHVKGRSLEGRRWWAAEDHSARESGMEREKGIREKLIGWNSAPNPGWLLSFTLCRLKGFKIIQVHQIEYSLGSLGRKPGK